MKEHFCAATKIIFLTDYDSKEFRYVRAFCMLNPDILCRVFKKFL